MKQGRSDSRLLLTLVFSSFLANPVMAGQNVAPTFKPGYRPAANTDEGGFWYQVDKIEQEVARSPQVVKDPDLNRYVDDLVCKLAGDYCSGIRVYIIKNPHFNASMYPNGMMHVWTGLLLRAENEAQLAAVLGHEIGHYLRAHQIERWRSLRDGASAAIFVDMILTMGLATMAVASGNSAFGRDQEVEADQFGMDLMVKQGYEPSEALNLWRYVSAEQAADKSKSGRSIFFATHPQPKQRIEKLEEAVDKVTHENHTEFVSAQQSYTSAIAPYYFDFMEDHFNLQEYEQTEVMLGKHQQLGYPMGQIYYFKGRLATLKKEEGFQSVAESALLASINAEGAPVESYRELGYLYLKSGKKAEAGGMFRKYLEILPEASDRKMIEFYLSSIGNANE